MGGDKDAATPRVFLIRHGETEWSQNGRYTGTTELPLLPSGEQKILQTARATVGAKKLIDPYRIMKIYCSPRERARNTLELLLSNVELGKGRTTPDTDFTEDVAEWGYGDYEGLKTDEILKLRAERSLDLEDTIGKRRKWDIWRDGTEGKGAETPQDVTARVDRVIDQITRVHGEYLQLWKEGGQMAVEERFRGDKDVLVVAHGHILRAFVKRWLGLDLAVKIELMLEPGGVCGLSYAHANVEERALLCGMSLPDGS